MIVKRKNDSRVYTSHKKGRISLKIKVPPTKFAQKMRDYFYMMFGGK